MVGEPFASEHATGRALEGSLWTFEHEHVVHCAARLEDTCGHSNQEHAIDGLGVRRGLDAQIVREPTVEAREMVPLECG
jgi:hypothetical protein